TTGLGYYISFKSNSANYLKKWYPFGVETIASNEQKQHQGNVYTLVENLPDLSNIKYVTIRCAPTNTGSTTLATIKYYFNQSPTASMTFTITGDQCADGYVRHEINQPYVNSIQMKIEWST